MHRAPARPVRACGLCANLLHGCCPRTSKSRTRVRPHAMQRQAKTFLTHPARHASHLHFTFHISSHRRQYLISSHLMSPHLIVSLLTCHLANSSSQLFSSRPSTEKSSSQLISALLQARKLLQIYFFSQQKRCAWDTDTFIPKTLTKYFALQSLHKVRPSTTLYYKACTKNVPVLLGLHKVRPSTILYYKACTKCVPVKLCTTKLARSTSQYFALQNLRKAPPSTSLYYQACTKYVPVLLCTTKLAQSTCQYYFDKALPSTTL